jgi:hypothetical protein
MRTAALTLITRKTFLAAVTDACTFLTLPGWPAEMNMQAYCMAAPRY